MTATRRLAAILAADVAGYSRLIGADEGGTLRGLKTIQIELIDPKIAAHNGRLVKTTGDGFLVEFSSVVDALRCAVEIQCEMAERNAVVALDRRIEFRVGINVGDVVVENGDIFGDGVNVAARLEGLAEPGGICVSARVQEDVVGKLDLAFEDVGEQRLKNIARPVRVYRIRDSEMAGEAMGAVQPSLTLPDRPSVAVLPLTNMSGDLEQEFFADGIAEDIITALSRYPSLFVIARNSSFTYKGRAVDVKQIGRDLGVRYVLEGSLRKSANRIRITAQLVEAETGKHVWAERYDRDLADIFVVQDEITEAVTVAVAPAIAHAELQRAIRKPPGNLDAWAAYQRGMWHLEKATVSDDAVAERFFGQAVDLDPTFADAYCGLAETQTRAAVVFNTRGLADAQNSVETSARLAVALDGSNAVAHACLSVALFLRGDHHGALVEAERALTSSPNLASGYWRRGQALIFSGQPQEGLRDLQTSLALEPRGVNLAHRLTQVAAGYYFSRAYEDAVEASKNVIRSFPNFPPPYRWLAAALGQLGRFDEANAALEQGLRVSPALFDLLSRGHPPWIRPQDQAHLLEGLRKAGMPEE